VRERDLPLAAFTDEAVALEAAGLSESALDEKQRFAWKAAQSCFAWKAAVRK
jgi:hypothetical protein